MISEEYCTGYEEGYANGQADTWDTAIRAQCKYCNKELAKPRNLDYMPFRNNNGGWVHDGIDKTGIWSVEFCSAGPLHEARRIVSEGNKTSGIFPGKDTP